MMTKREFGQVMVKAVSLLVVALGVLFMAGCGSNGQASQPVPPTVKPHYDAFYELAASKGRTNLPRPSVILAPINRSEFDGKFILGYCRSGSVVLNDKWWNMANETERRILVFHELGHCALGRDHLDTSKIVYDPNPDVARDVRTFGSIMNTTFIGAYAYALDPEGFDTELFSATSNPIPIRNAHSHDGCGIDE